MCSSGISHLILMLACGLVTQQVIAGQPETYPPAYEKLVEAARREGKVVVYSVLSNKAAQPLVNGFKALYPGIEVEYDGEGGSTETYERFVTEVRGQKPSADIMWSSAMDLQMKLVADGYAASYTSPEKTFLPAWAQFRDVAWGTTYEPVVFIFNRLLVPPADVPVDHASFARLITSQAARYRGKVTSFDIEKSGVGYMFAVQDKRHNPDWREFQKALGQSRVSLAAGTGEMLKKVNSGESMLGYNIMGAYALVRGKKDLPNLGVSIPQDYAPLLSRIMFINAKAAHPNAAKLWVDYMLSIKGQKIIGDELELFAIRDDANAQNSAAQLARSIGKAARPIPIQLELADSLQPDQQQGFIREWTLETRPPH